MFQDSNLCGIMDENKLFKCSSCHLGMPSTSFHRFYTSNRLRVVTSQCKSCRSNTYYAKRYNTVCACCTKRRPLKANGQCRKCNADSGIRECKVCKQPLPMFLKFIGRCAVCKDCLAAQKELAIGQDAGELDIQPHT